MVSGKAGAVQTVGPWFFLLPLVLTPLSFAFSAFAAMTWFPNAQGSGIPQAIAARHLHDEEDRSRLLALKLAFGKILLTVIGLLSGASIGREGPTVQVGASFMLAAARFGRMPEARGLILAAVGLSGSYNYFGSSSVAPQVMADWMLVPLCGVIGGALGAGFSGMALHFGLRIRRWAHPDPRRRMVFLATACGFAVAAIGIASRCATFGTSYEQARSAVEGEVLAPLFFAAKLAASFLSMLSGIPGGIFAPSLAVGAGLGNAIGAEIGANIALASILGMAAYFAGVVQAPITAFVIILEMTGDHRAVIPVLAVSMIGYLTSRFLSREPLHHALSRNLIAQVIRARREDRRIARADG